MFTSRRLLFLAFWRVNRRPTSRQQSAIFQRQFICSTQVVSKTSICGQEMAKELDLVSCIVSVYNVAEYLEDCFNGILSQSYPGPIEVSIYEDSSTDNSKLICEEWKAKFENHASGRFSVVLSSRSEETPLGAAHAKNEAVAQSTGRYLMMQDADDISLPNRIESQLKVCKQHPKAITGSMFCRSPVESTARYTAWCNSLATDQFELKLQQFRECTIIAPTWFLTRERFNQIKFQELTEDGQVAIADDLRFFLKHLEDSFPMQRQSECGCFMQPDSQLQHDSLCSERLLIVVPEMLLVYRYRQGSLCFKTPRKYLLELRVKAFEQRVIPHWSDGFTIWGNGRDGRAFFNCLSLENQAKVVQFCDIDPKKIRNGYFASNLNKKIPGMYKRKAIENDDGNVSIVVHWTEAKPPIVCCVTMDRTSGELERNVAALNLNHGIDFIHFV